MNLLAKNCLYFLSISLITLRGIGLSNQNLMSDKVIEKDVRQSLVLLAQNNKLAGLDFEEALLLMDCSLKETEEIKSSIAVLSKFTTRDSDNKAEAIHYLGILYSLLGQEEDSIQALKEALIVNPDILEYMKDRRLIRQSVWDWPFCYRGRFKLNFSESLFTESLSINSLENEPISSKDYFRRGQLRYALYDIQGAIRDYTKAIIIDDSAHEAYYNRAIATYEKSGDFGNKTIIDDLSKVIQLKPDFAEAYYNRGFIYFLLAGNMGHYLGFDGKGYGDGDIIYYDHETGNERIITALDLNPLVEQSKEDLTKAIDINPNFAAAYFIRGFLYNFLGEYKFLRLDRGLAIPDLLESIRINPNLVLNGEDTSNLLIAYLDDYDTVINETNLVIETEPQNIELIYRRAFTFLASGQAKEASKDFENIISLVEDSADAHYGLAVAYRQLNDIELAVEHLDSAIRLDSSISDYYLYRSFLRYELGDYQGSVRDASSAIVLDSTGGNAHFLRGLSLREMGAPEKDDAGYNFETVAGNLDFAFWLGWPCFLCEGGGGLEGDPMEYLNRGRRLARRGNIAGAINNLETAADLFQSQGDTARAQEAIDIIENLRR